MGFLWIRSGRKLGLFHQHPELNVHLRDLPLFCKKLLHFTFIFAMQFVMVLAQLANFTFHGCQQLHVGGSFLDRRERHPVTNLPRHFRTEVHIRMQRTTEHHDRWVWADLCCCCYCYHCCCWVAFVEFTGSEELAAMGPFTRRPRSLRWANYPSGHLTSGCATPEVSLPCKPTTFHVASRTLPIADVTAQPTPRSLPCMTGHESREVPANCTA